MGKYDDIEKREANRDGAVLVKNSGRSSKTTNKGDAIMDEDFLVDYKFTEKSFTLSRSVWAKVSTDAMVNGNRSPLLKVIMEGDQDSTLRLWIMDDREMTALRESRAIFDWLEQNRPEILAAAIEAVVS